MALKAKLEKLEGLPEPLAKEYKEVEEEGKKLYVLDIEGAEDVGALKRAKDHEKKARQEAEKKATETSSALEKLKEEIDEMRRGNIPKGDVEKLENSWKEKLAKREADLTNERDTALGTIRTLLVDNVAKDIAHKISNSPNLILPHIKARLTTEKTAEGYITRVLDQDGKPSAASIEELQKDFISNKEFAAIIIGSKASGGGASGGSGSGSGAPVAFDPKTFNPNTASPQQLVAYQKWKKEQGK